MCWCIRPYLRPGHDWNRCSPHTAGRSCDKLAETAGLERPGERIRFEERLTPQDIHDRYRVLNGAIYGLASHGRYGAFKPANRSPDVPGLYLAGGAAHPGAGHADGADVGLDRGRHARPGWRCGQTSRQSSWGDVFQRAQNKVTRSGNVAPRRQIAPLALLRFFTRYAHGYLRRNFHALRLWPGSRPPWICRRAR